MLAACSYLLFHIAFQLPKCIVRRSDISAEFGKVTRAITFEHQHMNVSGMQPMAWSQMLQADP